MKIVKLKYILGWMIVASLAALTACDVHEWPDEVEVTEKPYRLVLDFDTDMDEQDYFYDSRSAERMQDYEMRYIIRAFEYTEPARTSGEARSLSRAAMWEHTFTRPVTPNYYDCQVYLKIPKGEYTLMVWADFVKKGSDDDYFYAPSNFAEITLHDEHKANTDLRDAFRGIQPVEAFTLAPEEEPEDIVIKMERPLAKFTVVTTDLLEFFEREEEAARLRAEARGEVYDDSRGVKLEDYNVVFYYSGFMPCAYNMFTDKPVDSKTGVTFYSKLEQLNEKEASMGFDYVMVNGKDASVMVTMGLLDAEGNPVSLSDEINVPLNRSKNTIVRGRFLMQEASGGVGINPDFEGDYNIELK
ncbi:MAG: FimB/Mfa2 family fimbrial subunit [Bacteroidaceae bacterium]|nr:FimB/Mfa2 family fimbrial subunit [Bacteroidaceae bacterium]